jgi:hypothetical protein
MERVESEKEKSVLLCLYNNSKANIRDIVGEIGKTYGHPISVQGVANIIDKYAGIIRVSNSQNKYSVDKSKVRIKSFDMELFKQSLTPAVVALFFICFPLAFIFGIYALWVAVGGVLLFIPQMTYTVYKILKAPEHKEIYVSTSDKKLDTSKWVKTKDMPVHPLTKPVNS